MTLKHCAQALHAATFPEPDIVKQISKQEGAL